jgi:hypothetical protein
MAYASTLDATHVEFMVIARDVRGYTINVTRDLGKTSAQRICITSKVKPRRLRQMDCRHVFDVLPDRFWDTTSFHFYHGPHGTVELLQRGTSGRNRDGFCEAKYPHIHAKNPHIYNLL